MSSITVQHQVVVAWQEFHAAPHGPPGERIQDGRLQQVERQPLHVEVHVEQAGQHVGPIRRDGDTGDPRIEHPPDTGNGPLDPDLSGHRGHQMRAAHQRSRQPVEVGRGPHPTGGLGELAGRDRVVTDQRDLGTTGLADSHGVLGPAPEKPRPAGRVGKLLCRLIL
jgi:hypothetical protein